MRSKRINGPTLFLTDDETRYSNHILLLYSNVLFLGNLSQVKSDKAHLATTVSKPFSKREGTTR